MMLNIGNTQGTLGRHFHNAGLRHQSFIQYDAKNT